MYQAKNVSFTKARMETQEYTTSTFLKVLLQLKKREREKL